MTDDELRRAVDGAEDGYDVLALDTEDHYEGSCPCFTVRTDDGSSYEGHCWRVDLAHDGCGLHFEGQRDIAEAMAAKLTAMNWYGEWTVVEGLRR